jgi:hypothetical protein
LIPLVNISTGDGVEGDDVGAVDAMDGSVGATEVIAIDWRFTNNEKHLMYFKLQRNWSNYSWVITVHLSPIGLRFLHDNAHNG